MVFRRVTVALALGVLVLSSACGGGTQAPAEPSETPAPAPTEVTEPTSQPSPTPQAMFSSNRAQAIADAGVIRIGVRANSLPPFIELEGGHSGFEVELAEAIVAWLFGDAVEVEWVGLTPGDVFNSFGEGGVDFIIRNMVHSVERGGFALWSDNYFLVGLGVMVRSGEGVSSFADLDGKRVSVIAGTSIEMDVQTVADQLAIEVTQMPFDSGNAAFDAFMSGEADAYVNDWALLLTLALEDSSIEILPELYSAQPFAMALPLGEEDFRADINAGLHAILDDGTYVEIYNRWFDLPLLWTLEELLAAPPAG